LEKGFQVLGRVASHGAFRDQLALERRWNLAGHQSDEVVQWLELAWDAMVQSVSKLSIDSFEISLDYHL
jgi:hypothetical protein